MQYRILGKTGLKLSVLGFGVSPVGNVFEPVDESEAIRALHYGIDHGINFYDVAPFYGDTLAETRLGKALVDRRHNIILATKVCRYIDHFDFSYNRVIKGIDESLQRLQTDYVDVFQLHDIEFGSKEQVLNEAIPAILKVKESGKARFVGITGLPVRYLAHIIQQVDLDTVLSWGHYNLVEDEINDELVPLSIEKGFGLVNAAPFMQRILTNDSLPSWHRSPQPLKDIQPVLIDICNKYGYDLSDVALAYAVSHPHIATTIAGMCQTHIVEKNIRAAGMDVPPALLEELAIAVEPVKNLMWFEGREENNLPKNK